MATITAVAPTASTANASSYASAAFTPAAGDYLVVGIVAGATTGGTNGGTLTGSAGLTFRRLRSNNGAAGDVVQIFVSNEKATAVSQTVTYDCTGDAADGCVIMPCRVAGVNVLVERQNAGQGWSAGATPVIGQQFNAHTDSLVFAAIGNATNAAGVTAPTGFTRTHNSGYGTPTTGAAFYSINTGYTSNLLTFGSTSATAGGGSLVEFMVDKPESVFRGFAAEQTADTSIVASPTTTIPAGRDVLVVAVADNSGAGGTAPWHATTPISDTDGNAWTQRQDVTRSGGGSPNDGVSMRAWTATLNAAMSTSDTVTISFAQNTTGKVVFIHELVPGTAGRQLQYVGNNNDAGGSSTPSVTRTGVPQGRLLVGVLGIEHDATVVADVANDALGPWYRQMVSAEGGGSTTSTVRLTTTRKYTEGTGDSTWAPTLSGTSVDWAIAILEFQETVVGTVGQAAEADAAQPLTKTKARAAGQAAGTEIAQSIAVVQSVTVPVVQAAETAAAVALTRTKAEQISQSAESGAAATLTRDKARELGRADETDLSAAIEAVQTNPDQTVEIGQTHETGTAQSASRTKLRSVGQTAEVDTAGATARRKEKPVGQAVEADAAILAGRSKTETVAQAAETDLSLGLSGRKLRGVGQAVETSDALEVTRLQAGGVAAAVETDTSGGVSRSKAKQLTQSAENTLAQQLARSKARPVGQAATVGDIGTITPARTVGLGQPAEVDTAGTLGETKRRLVGQAAEVDQATSLSGSVAVAVSQASEVEAAGATGRSKIRALLQAVETSVAGLFGRRKSKSTGQTAEAGTATPLGRSKSEEVAQTAEADASQPLSHARGRTVGLAAEQDLAESFGRTKTKLLGLAAEADTVQAVSYSLSQIVGIATELDFAQAVARVQVQTLSQALEIDLSRPINAQVGFAEFPVAPLPRLRWRSEEAFARWYASHVRARWRSRNGRLGL